MRPALGITIEFSLQRDQTMIWKLDIVTPHGYGQNYLDPGAINVIQDTPNAGHGKFLQAGYQKGEPFGILVSRSPGYSQYCLS